VNRDERDSVAAQFGASGDQVERDHHISHVLAFLGTSVEHQIQFIGGTAPARTHQPERRLSEDIDLIALDDRKAVAAPSDAALPRALDRSHGDLPVAALPYQLTRIMTSVTIRRSSQKRGGGNAEGRRRLFRDVG
jgi:hypothetical protein